MSDLRSFESPRFAKKGPSMLGARWARHGRAGGRCGRRRGGRRGSARRGEKTEAHVDAVADADAA